MSLDLGVKILMEWRAVGIFEMGSIPSRSPIQEDVCDGDKTRQSLTPHPPPKERGRDSVVRDY